MLAIYACYKSRKIPGNLIWNPDIYSRGVGKSVNDRDRIWQNLPYGIRARLAQSAFLVAQVEICQKSPDFVIFIVRSRVIHALQNLFSNLLKPAARGWLYSTLMFYWYGVRHFTSTLKQVLPKKFSSSDGFLSYFYEQLRAFFKNRWVHSLLALWLSAWTCWYWAWPNCHSLLNAHNPNRHIFPYHREWLAHALINQTLQ